MDYQTGLLPDTRPKYLISQMYNWLLRTDNIRISEKNNDLMFIDTRWLWDRNANFIKRGTIIPEMIENLAKGYINLLLEELE
jgi:predicted DNA-binding transcriptional regulator